MKQPAVRKAELDALYHGFRDHERFCEACLTIPDRSGRVVPLRPTAAHRRLSEAIRRQRARKRPVRIVYLKPRRVGVSVGCCAELFHGVPFVSGQHAFVTSYQKDSAEEIFSYVTHFQNEFQPYGGLIGLPSLKRKVGNLDQSTEARRRIDWMNGSYIRVATAKNVKTGRSFDVRHVLLDEFAFYDNASKLMTSIMQSVPDDPDTTVIIPSTANGVGGPFYELCQKAADPAQESEWIFLFFGWWEEPSYARPLEMPADEFQSSLAREHPVYGDELAERAKYGLSLEQLHWRRWTIVNKCGGSLDTFRQEYPGEPTEAFLASGRPRFDLTALSRMPVLQDLITGDLVVENVGTRSKVFFQAREDGRGSLTLVRRPDPLGEYVIGGDTSQGKDVREGTPGNSDPDYSVAEVFDRRSGEQCATFRAREQPAQFGQTLYDLGRYFNWAYQVPEAVGAGLGTVEKLLELQYPLDRLYKRRPEADVSSSRLLQYYGYETNTVSREQLISALDDALREQAIILRNPRTVQECRTFVIKPNGRAEHADECHDDEVFGTALAVIGLRTYPRTKTTATAPKAAVRRYGLRRSREDDD